MFKKKILSLGLVSLMCVPLAFCAVGCGKKDDNKKHLTVNANDVYAMSVATSVNYLQEKQGAGATASVLDVATRPALITDEDVNNLKYCVGLFGEVITNNGITQQTENNNKVSHPDYNFVMEISFPNSTEVLTMYYNEFNQQTKEEIDDFEKEIEISTELQGIVEYNGSTYRTTGVKEVEIEGNEIEVEVEFTTYLDNNNYIVVEQSVENGELEYEYSIYENNKKIQEVELEIEYKNSQVEIEFQIVDLTSHLVKETEYELLKNELGKLSAVVEKNEIKEYITIELDENLTFTYSNGYTETVSLSK